jgi:hypothetical protein
MGKSLYREVKMSKPVIPERWKERCLNPQHFHLPEACYEIAELESKLRQWEIDAAEANGIDEENFHLRRRAQASEVKVAEQAETIDRLTDALRGLWERHNDGSEERFWVEWDTAQDILAIEVQS